MTAFPQQSNIRLLADAPEINKHRRTVQMRAVWPPVSFLQITSGFAPLEGGVMYLSAVYVTSKTVFNKGS